jgi:microcystin degradation protein MlrC
MTANNSDKTSTDKTDDHPTAREVATHVPDAGAATVERCVHKSETDVTCVPVREPATPADVTICFAAGRGATAELTLSSEAAYELIDAIQQALDVEPFDE